MFEIGDFICYGGDGVCRVADVGKLDFGGDALYYTLNPVRATDSVIYAPVEGKAYIRPCVTKEQALDYLGKACQI